MAHTNFSFGNCNRGIQVGINNGSVYPPPDRLETPPEPSCIIPFCRDPDFIARQALLEQLDEKCSVPVARVALVGLGGVGKSQLAIEYSYRVGLRLPKAWVFWVRASNAVCFEQSYRGIAEYVKIPGRRDPKADIFKLVHDWLRDERKGKWFLVLDNVDNACCLLEPRTITGVVPASGSPERFTRSLWDYLPPSQNGSVLVTTRSRGEALKLVEECNIITVGPMDEADAVTLFEKKLSPRSDRGDSIELVTALEFMPLAVVQAAAYINKKAPRFSVRNYIQKFQEMDRNKTILLIHKVEHCRRDQDAINSIIMTWYISFDSIKQERPSAADLLSLMSFFDGQGIPESLLRNGDITGNGNRDFYNQDGNSNRHDEEVSRSQTSVTDEFEEDVLVLRNYSFIFVDKDATTFRMYRLVQVAIQTWLKAHGELEKWKEQFIRKLCAEFPDEADKNLAKCGALSPHVQLALEQEPVGVNLLREWALLLFNAAWYGLMRCSPSVVKKMSVKSMEVTKKLLGQDHQETLDSQDMVTLVYLAWGSSEEAEEQLMQLLETKKRVLGQEHPETLDSITHLAWMHWNLGRWKEAEELFIQLVETRKRLQGQEDFYTLTSMYDLTLLYRDQGRWEEAEELFIQVEETGKRVQGQEYSNMLTSMADHVRILKKRNRDAMAIHLMLSHLLRRK